MLSPAVLKTSVVLLTHCAEQPGCLTAGQQRHFAAFHIAVRKSMAVLARVASQRPELALCQSHVRGHAQWKAELQVRTTSLLAQQQNNVLLVM
jgi:hypothetical protein